MKIAQVHLIIWSTLVDVVIGWWSKTTLRPVWSHKEMQFTEARPSEGNYEVEDIRKTETLFDLAWAGLFRNTGTRNL